MGYIGQDYATIQLYYLMSNWNICDWQKLNTT